MLTTLTTPPPLAPVPRLVQRLARTARGAPLAACAALLLSGCAALDPHAVLTRRIPAPADASASAAGATPLDAATRAAAFDFVWRTVDERYYDPKMNGVDWKAVGAKWRKPVLEAPDDDAFWDRLDRMAGELRDVHTRVVSPRRAALQQRFQSVSLGFGFRLFADALVVTSVNGESDAWWAGVRPGMTLVEVDGEPAGAVYARLRTEAREGSTEQQRHTLAAHQAAYRFGGGGLFLVHFLDHPAQ